MTEASTESIGVGSPGGVPGVGPPPESDADLWDAIAGDGPAAHAAFTELFQRHAEAVWNYAYRLTASWAQADDLLSTAFLNAWRTRGRAVLTRDSARPWLFTVTARLARDERRAGARPAALRQRLSRTSAERDHADAVVDDDFAERRLRRVVRAVDRLPDGVRAAALTRLQAGFAAPPPRRLPLKVAAAAVAVVAATTLTVLLTDGGDPGPATAPTPAEHPELRHQDPASFYDLRTGSAADDAEDRCRAGTSTAERWTPIATASRRRVALTAFETPAGTVFCETTPLSSPCRRRRPIPVRSPSRSHGRRVDGGVQRRRSPFVPARRTPGPEPGRPRGAGRPGVPDARRLRLGRGSSPNRR